MSIRDDLHHLLQRIAAETGDVCEPQPAAGLNTDQDLPEALRSFYSETNGLELPFLKVFSVEQLPHMQGYVLDSSWILFGQDYYFSFYLCAKTPSSDGALITTWDRESDAEVEPAFRTVLELLNDEYEQHITTRLGGIGGAVLSITAMPTSVSLA